MSVNTAGIQKGMDVYGTDGQKIGTVADILNVQAYSETGAPGAVNAGPTTAYGGTAPASNQAGEGAYLKIDQGGIMGIGATELYVPFSKVSNVVPDDNLTIDCTKGTCDTLYGNKPDFLS